MSSTFKESFTVKGEQLLKKIKELIDEGNVRKITIHDKNTPYYPHRHYCIINVVWRHTHQWERNFNSRYYEHNKQIFCYTAEVWKCQWKGNNAVYT